MKNLLWSFALLLTVSACGNHYSTQDAYVAFRGRPPSVEGLMKNRGLTS